MVSNDGSFLDLLLCRVPHCGDTSSISWTTSREDRLVCSHCDRTYILASCPASNTSMIDPFTIYLFVGLCVFTYVMAAADLYETGVAGSIFLAVSVSFLWPVLLYFILTEEND